MTDEQLDWRTGSWSGSLGWIRAVTGRIDDGNPELGVLRELRSQFSTNEHARHEYQQRHLQIASLARLACRARHPMAADREAGRRALAGERAMATAEVARLVLWATEDMLYRDDVGTQAHVAAIRAVKAEDVENIFDFDDMADAAVQLGLAELTLAEDSRRFDDLRMGWRLCATYVNSGHGDRRLLPGVLVALLRAIYEVPTASKADAAQRHQQILQLQPLLRSLQPDDPDGDGAKLLERAVHVSPADFPPEARSHIAYEAIFARLHGHFLATKNPVYLDDLLVYLTDVRPQDSQHRQARMLGDRAIVVGVRGDEHVRLTDHEHARRLISAALDAAAGDPLLPTYESLAELIESRKGRPRTPAHSSADGPPLPPEQPIADLQRGMSASELVARANADLLVAAELLLGSPERDALTLQIVESATTAMERCIESDTNDRAFVWFDAFATAAAARAIRASPTSAGQADHWAMLAGVLSDPRRFPNSYINVAAAAASMGLEDEAVREVVIGALAEASAIVSERPEERLREALTIGKLRIALGLVQGDYAGELAPRVALVNAIVDLISAAIFATRSDPQRVSASEELLVAGMLARDVAIGFAVAGEPNIAAFISERAAGLRLGDSIFWDGSIASLDALGTPSNDVVPCCMIVQGSAVFAILERPPGGDWDLSCVVPRDTGPAVFTEHPQFTAATVPFHILRRDVTKIATRLDTLAGEVLKRLQSLSDLPTLYLPSGSWEWHAITAIATKRPEVRLPVVVATTSLSDRVARSLSAPAPEGACVTILVGASTVADLGTLDVEGDIREIRATTPNLSLVRSASGDFEAQLQRANFIHYAGHLIPAGPDATTLLFSDGTGIEARAIALLRLENVDAVTLMACHSGFTSRAESAEQMESIAGAFLEAGAGAVVAALWPIYDRPAHLFSRRFYAEVAVGGSVAGAFREGIDAVRGYRNGDVQPYDDAVFWGGFALFAGPRSAMPAGGYRRRPTESEMVWGYGP